MTVKEISQLAGVGGSAADLARDDSTPQTYLASLEKQELYLDAIRFLAQKLPPDAGIKWAARCLRELADPQARNQKDEALEAVERWIQAPGDPTRWAAKNAGEKPEANGGSALAAMAVFMSGGSLSPPGNPEVQPPPYAAQKMVAGTVQVAVVSYQPEKAKERYQRALAMGKELDTPA